MEIILVNKQQSFKRRRLFQKQQYVIADSLVYPGHPQHYTLCQRDTPRDATCLAELRYIAA
jgi:hypothetical protein